MTLHYHREIERLKKKMLSLSALVEENVRLAVKSVGDRDADMANKVIDSDIEIDQMEVEIEEDCLKLFALYQPVAVDLRFLVSILKINNDLERIGDLAVNIAKRSAVLVTKAKIDFPFDFTKMAEIVQTMLRKCLDALVNLNSEMAREVCMVDEEVDIIHKEVFSRVDEGIRKNIEDLDTLIHFLSISRHLERIADHATNIAEDVYYMVEGEIIRHHRKYDVMP